MSESAIITKGLGKQYRRKWAVQDLDLHVPKGSAFGLLGPNGAGKSTTINMLMGLLPATSGSVTVLGIDPARDDVAVRRRVGYVAEIHGFYGWMSVDDTIGLVAPYHKNWNWQTSDSLKQEFGLDGDSRVDDLSKGMRAKLALLLVLSFDPEMLVLDEPTGGLDPAARRNFIETVLGRFQETGKTILVSSHLINEFAGLLDHVAFLKNGKLHLDSRLDDLHQRMKRARLVFPDQVPAGFAVPGALAVRSNGRESLVTLQDFDPQRTPEELRKTGAANIEIEELTLEDIFVDLVGS
ncbi:MAG: ABC transporter ATP-binding protein [bacterium]